MTESLNKLIKTRKKHKHPECPYPRSDKRYDKWYFQHVTKPKREEQRRKNV